MDHKGERHLKPVDPPAPEEVASSGETAAEFRKSLPGEFAYAVELVNALERRSLIEGIYKLGIYLGLSLDELNQEYEAALTSMKRERGASDELWYAQSPTTREWTQTWPIADDKARNVGHQSLRRLLHVVKDDELDPSA
ncbi:MAG TPA: hypothetical protein VFT49_00620 [Candidatus Saccharimonadales bacterium]|nr:hypothetical protein [Candidatus Saccharimonadales bacterium]